METIKRIIKERKENNNSKPVKVVVFKIEILKAELETIKDLKK